MSHNRLCFMSVVQHSGSVVPVTCTTSRAPRTYFIIIFISQYLSIKNHSSHRVGVGLSLCRVTYQVQCNVKRDEGGDAGLRYNRLMYVTNVQDLIECRGTEKNTRHMAFPLFRFNKWIQGRFVIDCNSEYGTFGEYLVHGFQFFPSNSHSYSLSILLSIVEWL